MTRYAHCGHPQAPEARFCEVCGVALAAPAQTGQLQAEPSPATPGAPPSGGPFLLQPTDADEPRTTGGGLSSAPPAPDRALEAQMSISPDGRSSVTSGARADLDPPVRKPRARRNRWRVGVTGVILLVLGIFGTGLGVGWVAGSRSVDGAAGNTTVEVIGAPSVADGDLVVLPDVRGLLLVDAQQAITDAGFPLDIVAVQNAASALPAGTVVTQDPVGGSEDVAQVTLFVAVPGSIPDLIGHTADDARRALLQLGATFQQQQRYDPAAIEGTVLAVDPPAGSPFTGSVTVTVAAPADSVFLADLEAEEGTCNDGETGVNGNQYDHALVCTPGSATSPRTTTYLTNRLGTTLDAVVGLSDSSDTDAAATLTVLGDGRVLARLDVRYGQSQPLSVPIGGVLRLDLQYASSGEGSGQLAFGDARIVGSPDAITTLAGQ
ncbi:PASTA domain-containing protein [Geodermatophilus sp. SYSU D00710]